MICLILLRDGLEIEVKVHLNSDRFVLVGGKTPNNCKLQNNSHKYPPCMHCACRRQHQTRTFTDHATSEGKPSPTSYLYINKNPDICKDYPYYYGLLNHTEIDLLNGLVSQCIIFEMV